MVRNVAIVMNGVKGRMGICQHLEPSLLAIREQGGVVLPDGEVILLDPILVGRNEKKLRSLAEEHGTERWSTDLDENLADPEVEIYLATSTPPRKYVSLINDYAGKINGIKVSLLDAGREVEIRRRPDGVRMYTGDDFDCPGLIRGDVERFSHALLGIFDAIAPAASAALQALDAGDTDRYEKILAPTVPLSRHIFQAPTRYHKTGVVFLAYINGHQDHFRMVGRQEGARSVTHLSELFVLADRAGLLHDPDLYPQISRASGRIFGFHANDWLSPKPDLLLSRAMMGDGPIEIRRIRAAVDAAGYAGPIEVEIFNQEIWNAPGKEVIALTKERYLQHA